jgi:hypothetical protein
MNFNLQKTALTIFKGVIIYALVWGIVFGVCFTVDKTTDNATTASALQWGKYAGYPLLGIAWVLGWIVAGFFYVLSQTFLGALYLLKITFPYCLYVIGVPAVGVVFYKVATHLASQTGPTRAELEAQARHQETMRVVKEAMLLKSISDMSRD